jgi:hypothetical protein
MTVAYNPLIPTSTLVMCYDAANPKSYSPNVIPNPLDLYAWCGTASVNTGSISRDTTIDRSPAGGIPLKLTSTGTDAYIATFNTLTWNLAPAANGQTWTMSYWAKASTTAQALPYLFSANASGNYLEAPSSGVTVTTFWQRFSFTATFSGASTAWVQARLGNTTNGASIWFDGLQVERANAVTTFNPQANLNGTTWKNLISNDSTTNAILYYQVTPNVTSGLLSFNGNVTGGAALVNGYNVPVAKLGTTNWTISIWWKANSTSQTAYSALLSQGFTGSPINGAWAFKISHSSTNYNFTYYNNGIVDNLSGVDVNDLAWHHLVVVRNGTSLILYKDNVQSLSITLPSNYNFGDGSLVYIGYNPRDGSYINGSISNISVFTSALSTVEILQIYNTYKGRYGL